MKVIFKTTRSKIGNAANKAIDMEYRIERNKNI
jgi:hypothetical protein